MENADKLRLTPIHESGNRPHLVLGGDRELVLISMLVVVSLAFSLATVWGVGRAALLWVTAMWALQRMAKADPLLRQVYVRHIRYRPYYPAKSGLHSQALGTPIAWR